jgi:hypothetical protein
VPAPKTIVRGIVNKIWPLKSRDLWKPCDKVCCHVRSIERIQFQSNSYVGGRGEFR